MKRRERGGAEKRYTGVERREQEEKKKSEKEMVAGGGDALWCRGRGERLRERERENQNKTKKINFLTVFFFYKLFRFLTVNLTNCNGRYHLK